MLHESCGSAMVLQLWFCDSNGVCRAHWALINTTCLLIPECRLMGYCLVWATLLIEKVWEKKFPDKSSITFTFFLRYQRFYRQKYITWPNSKLTGQGKMATWRNKKLWTNSIIQFKTPTIKKENKKGRKRWR